MKLLLKFLLCLVVLHIIQSRGQELVCQAVEFQGYTEDRGSRPWELIETKHFEVKFRPLDKFYGESIAENAESPYDSMKDSITDEDIDKIWVYVARDDEEFGEFKHLKVKPPDWAAGLAFPYDNFIILKSPASLKGITSDRALLSTFKHELSHLFLNHAAGDYAHNIPRWFDEGFSIYQSDEWEFRHITALSFVGISNSYIPFRDLTYGFPHDEDGAVKAYAQSASIVAYLYERFGNESMRELIKTVRMGHSFNGSIRSVLDEGFSQIEVDWRKRARTYYTWIPIITSTTTLWFIASIVVAMGYIKRRKRYKEALFRMEEEEQEELYH